MPEPKEPYVPKEDRPDVKLPDPDKPISELRVRDLQAIIGSATLKKIEIKEPIKDFKHEKWEIKEPFKDFKDHKHEKWEIKEHIKDLKSEKLEHDPIVKAFDLGPDPSQLGDPAVLGQIAEAIGGLTKRVSDLANQVAELQKKVK